MDPLACVSWLRRSDAVRAPGGQRSAAAPHTLPVRPLGRLPRHAPAAGNRRCRKRDAGDEHASPTFAAWDRGRPVPSMMPFSLGSLVGRSVRPQRCSWITPSTSLNATVAHLMSLHGARGKRCPFVHTCVSGLACLEQFDVNREQITAVLDFVAEPPRRLHSRRRPVLFDQRTPHGSRLRSFYLNPFCKKPARIAGHGC
jgi:hypothetical protein